jgi:agmatinase
MMNRIETTATAVLSDNKFLLTLGGEHSITGPLVKAHKSKFDNLSVLQIDAHSDLRDEYQGTPYSHACVMSRVWEYCEFVSVGIRSFCGSENMKKALSQNRIYTTEDFRADLNSISKILSMLTDHVYITVDLDGFDPSVIPAVGTPEPGGLLWHEVLNLIRQVGREKKIIGADIVELSPIPGMIHPDFTAALLAYKIIGIALNRKE